MSTCSPLPCVIGSIDFDYVLRFTRSSTQSSGSLAGLCHIFSSTIGRERFKIDQVKHLLFLWLSAKSAEIPDQRFFIIVNIGLYTNLYGYIMATVIQLTPFDC